MLLTLPARGQDCSPVARSGFTGGSVSLCTSQNIGPQTIGAGESYWTSPCGGTGSIPFFYVDKSDADVQIQVYYHLENGPDACVATSWAGQVPTQIDLWAAGPGPPNGELMNCNPTESLAHEMAMVSPAAADSLPLLEIRRSAFCALACSAQRATPQKATAA
jgi:hypothetical protein